MAEMNEIFTRIQLKYDSYNAWTTNNPTLLAGEVAIAKLVNDVTVPVDEAKNAPVLFKVGPGAFNDLPWVSGLAADVYAWAKAKEIIAEGEGNAVTGVTVRDNTDGTKSVVLNKAETFATKKELEDLRDGLEADTNTTYNFSIPTEGEDAGKLLVQKKEIGESEWTKVGAYDFVTPNELTGILEGYYTKTEVDNLIQGVRDDIPDELGVMSVELLAGTANGSLKLKVNGEEGADVVVTGLEEIKVKNATHADAATKVNTAFTVKVGGTDVIFDGSEAKTADVDAAIAQTLADAKKYTDDNEKDTKTAVKASGNYITVAGPATLVENTTNEYTVSINEDALKTLIGEQTTAAMEFKGATTELPVEPVKGDMWKVSGEFEVAGTTAKVGDAIVYNGTEWFLIPSGDDIEDTWRPIELNGQVIFGGGITSGNLNLVPGTNITIETKTGEDGKTYLSFAAHDTTYSADESSLHLEGTIFGVKEDGIETKHIKNGNVTEAKLEQNVQDALALARTALQEHQSLDNYKTKQTAVVDKGLTGAKVLGSLIQNENGEIDYTVRDLTPADIGAQAAGDYATKKEVADQDVVILAEAQKYTDGKVSELHPIATSGSIYDIAEGHNTSTGEDGVKYLVFNCGTSTSVI